MLEVEFPERDASGLQAFVSGALARVSGGPIDWPGVGAREREGGLEAAFLYPPFRAGLEIGRWIARSWRSRRIGKPPASLTLLHRQAVDSWNRVLPLLDEARRRGLPVRLEQTGLVQAVRIGVGRDRRRLVHAVMETSSGSGTFGALHKEIARDLLAGIGLPVAKGGLAGTPEEARKLARSIGWPVVLKSPIGGDFDGVVLGIGDEAALGRAWRHVRGAIGFGPLLLEAHVPGSLYRAIVVGGRLRWVAEGIATEIVADGRATGRELVERAIPGALETAYHRRRFRGVLLSQGLDFETRPRRGSRLRVTPPTAAWRVLDRVHPTTKRVLERAAHHLGLQMAGIEFVTTDPAAPLEPGSGAIIECNQSPGFCPPGEEARLARWTLEALYDGRPRRTVPVVAAIGVPSASRVLRAARDGLARGGERVAIVRSDADRCVLEDHSVEAVVLEVDPCVADRSGLPVDRLEGVLAGPAADPELALRMVGLVGRGGRIVLAEGLLTGAAPRGALVVPAGAPGEAWVRAARAQRTSS